MKTWFKAAKMSFALVVAGLALPQAHAEFVSPFATMPLSELRAQANTGNAFAQFYLANRYKSGQGVAPDLAQAFEWYLKAAEQGAPEAQVNVGLMYARAQGVAQQDIEKAVYWLERAAAQGNTLASYNLGIIAEAQQKLTDAYKWYDLSAREGMRDRHAQEQARSRIRQLAVNLPEQAQRDAVNRATEWFQNMNR